MFPTYMATLLYLVSAFEQAGKLMTRPRVAKASVEILDSRFMVGSQFSPRLAEKGLLVMEI